MNRWFWIKLSLCVAMAGMSPLVSGMDAFAQNPANTKAASKDSGKADKSSKNSTGKKTSSKKDKKTAVSKKSAKSLNQTIDTMDALKQSVENMFIAFSAGQYGTALVYCEQSIKVMPNNADPKIRSNVYSMCMQLYERNGRLDEALEMAAKARQLDVDEKTKDSLCFSEATLLTKKHLWDEARARYNDCPGKTTGERAIVTSNLAELLMIVEQPEDAVKKYESAIALSGDNPSSQFGLAVALSRANRWDDSIRQFWKAIELDPGLNYLKYEFFEPAAETDYQTAFRMMAMHRSREARFYLQRYVKSEMRTGYRTIAERELDRIDAEIRNEQTVIRYAVPLLFENVRSIAIDNSGTHLAVASMERIRQNRSKSSKKNDEKNILKNISTSVWTLDVESGETARRMGIDSDVVTDMSFVGDSPHLRVITGMRRFDLDVADSQSGYYVYENHPDAFALGIDEGENMVSVTDGGWLTLAPWLNPVLQVPIVRIPSESRQLVLAADHRSIMLDASGEVRLIKTETGDVVRTFSSAFEIGIMAAHPTSNMYALGMQTGTLLVDGKGKIQAVLGSPNLAEVDALSFSPDGRWLAVASGNQVEVWDVAKSLELH